MKILWFYKYDKLYNFDHWFHMDFARELSKNGAEVRAFGPNLEELYKDMIVCGYDEKLDIWDIHKKFPFDVMVLSTKSRMFDYYNPNTDRAEGCWLPKGTHFTGIPKVVLEEDYHYERSDHWYHKLNIDLVIQRHYANYIRQKDLGETKCTWLPLSVNTEIFKPNPNIIRTNKIAFAANSNANIYPLRTKGKEVLKRQGLLHDYHNKAKEHLYIECLQKYVAFLSCSSVYHVTPAKMFEIMATGGLLLTNNSTKYGLKQLFPNGSYITYKEDLSDLVDKARWIIENKEEVKTIAESGRQCILDRHSDEVRAKQLIEILEKL